MASCTQTSSSVCHPSPAPKDPLMGGGICLMGLPCISKQMQYSKYQSREHETLYCHLHLRSLHSSLSIHLDLSNPKDIYYSHLHGSPRRTLHPQGPSHILLSLRGEGGIPSLLVLMQMTIVDPNAIFRMYQITNTGRFCLS